MLQKSKICGLSIVCLLKIAEKWAKNGKYFDKFGTFGGQT